ncbi:VOC family protein [Flavobacterium sp. Fl-77]|uniref:VOC family protein n=1 Tax=Flavobacterium flavipigmentatum TaxID=2893884 RepID=A0AAJ2SF46_9FLAO|nr:MULTISPECIES: VOC family protein [unclassified Flavobacterium]MDX6183783.1 VOC family protein [Flavobacterium sp. Fl-33]MDX6187256.1 VOC family protein [Flavobacterium sp. Fl-77]UFH38071.1 VOC family protein [Flavobacterium sp. F-70]
MARINPYIHFNGNAEAAFTFYKSVFGGEFSKISHYKDIASDEYPISENDAERIMHIALPINNGNALMASDTLTSMGQVMETDNRYTVFISVESQEEAVKLFVGLSNGGTIEMPINYGPSGNYFGMFADKFGVQWMVDFDPRNT